MKFRDSGIQLSEDKKSNLEKGFKNIQEIKTEFRNKYTERLQYMKNCICEAGFTLESAKSEEALYRIWLNTEPFTKSFQKYIIDVYYNNQDNTIKSGEQVKAYM